MIARVAVADDAYDAVLRRTPEPQDERHDLGQRDEQPDRHRQPGDRRGRLQVAVDPEVQEDAEQRRDDEDRDDRGRRVGQWWLTRSS